MWTFWKIFAVCYLVVDSAGSLYVTIRRWNWGLLSKIGLVGIAAEVLVLLYILGVV